MVCFFKMNPTGQHDAKGREKLIPMLRYYNVFNIEQTQGLSIEAPTPKAPFNPIEACEKALASYKDKPMLQHKGNRACYSPALDIVNMPNREAFNTREDYYATLFHELAHSTGHEKRLARAGLVDAVSFGSETYSKEELVAEIASSFLCTQTGIEQVTLSNSVAYIQGWLSKLSDDETLIVKAASQAKKASEYILGTKEEKEETE
jgi:antirestriction protein ArdC